jgi:hypothetical protein
MVICSRGAVLKQDRLHGNPSGFHKLILWMYPGSGRFESNNARGRDLSNDILVSSANKPESDGELRRTEFVPGPTSFGFGSFW